MPPSHPHGLVIFFTGLPGAGKSTLAQALAGMLEQAGRAVTLLDGDEVRRLLSSELGYSRAHRDLNVLRIGYVATEVARHGGVAICAQIAPYAAARAEVRRYELWQPWQTDHATVESAWAVESRYGLHYRDSLVVAAAQHLGCRYLLSEDLAHEQHYGGVQVINPFKTGIELLEQAP